MTMLCLSFSSCTIQRPDTNIYGVNAPGYRLEGYNMKKDYDNDGNRKPDAKKTIKLVSGLSDINKWICTDPEGYENLLTYGKNLREEYLACKRDKRLLEAGCTISK